MRIAYLLETTGLCGGVKVVFNHVNALIKKGHTAFVLSYDSYPEWLDKNVPFKRIQKIGKQSLLDIKGIEDFDVIVGTSPLHLVKIYNDLKRKSCEEKIVHFIQGYEGDYHEGKPFMSLIKEAYSLPVRKMTVSDNLSQRLLNHYPDQRFISCGQGLETDFFYTRRNASDFSDIENDTVFLMGSLDISIKRIRTGLKAYKIASAKKPGFKLVRISIADTRDREEKIAGRSIHEFYSHLTPREVGALFRSRNGILLSPSSAAEGFGLPPIEAMACGIPVVLTDIPSYKSFGPSGDYAVFVPVDDPVKMADALIDIAENKAETAFRIKKGLAVAGNYSYSKVVENLEVIFSNV